MGTLIHSSGILALGQKMLVNRGRKAVSEGKF
jgi:hypothetical protein